MPHTLTMPTVNVVPPYLPDTTGQALRLFMRYHVNARGVNIFIMSDGTVRTDYPVLLSTGPNVYSTVGSPYPWNPTQSQIDETNTATGGEQPPVKGVGATPSSGPQAGSFPFVHVDNPLAPLQTPPQPEVLEVSTNPYCVSWFRGGTGPHVISDAMYAILHAAGFASFLT